MGTALTIINLICLGGHGTSLAEVRYAIAY